MKEVASCLLRIKAVSINVQERFTWASGIKSPIYTDNRLICSYPNERSFIEEAFSNEIIKRFPEVEALFGTATAGIPHAAYVSEILKLPMGYIRGDTKKHGRKNQIEGHVIPGSKIVIIEDLLSTGKSSLAAVEAAQDAGLEVLGVASIFSYQLRKLKNNFANIEHFSLTNLNELLEVSLESGLLKPSDIESVKQFRDELG